MPSRSWVTKSDLWCHKTLAVDYKNWRKKKYKIDWLTCSFDFLLIVFPASLSWILLETNVNLSLFVTLQVGSVLIIVGLTSINYSKSSLATIINSYRCKLSGLAAEAVWARRVGRSARSAVPVPDDADSGWRHLSSSAPGGSAAWVLQPFALCDRWACQPCLAAGPCC